MVRAAAKNHAHVGVVVDPADYEPVLAELRPRAVRSSDDDPAPSRPNRVRPHRGLRRRDRHVVRRDRRRSTADAADRSAAVDPSRHSSSRSRCGTARTRTSRVPAIARPGRTSWWDVDDAARRQGAQLPERVRHRGGVAARPAFDEPACVIVKHANPCGVAVADRHRRGLHPWPTRATR